MIVVVPVSIAASSVSFVSCFLQTISSASGSDQQSIVAEGSAAGKIARPTANSTHDVLGPPKPQPLRCSPAAVSGHGSPQLSASGAKAASSGSPRLCKQPKKPAAEAASVAAGDAASKSRQQSILTAVAAAAAMPDHDVLLGCPKCRYAKNGCGVCRVSPAMARHKQLRWQPAAGRPQTVRHV